MSVSMTKGEGVTMFTLTFDPQSNLPPLCQILRALCYSPVCCSVSKHMKSAGGKSQTLLGTIQIMVGLLNIGLGVILMASNTSSWMMDDTKYSVWLGVLFMLFGIMCILSENFPSPCLVTLNVILNMAGVIFAITAITLYIVDLTGLWFRWMCSNDRYDYTDVTLSPESMEKCLEGKHLVVMLSQSIHSVLIVLSVLELCVTISSTVLGIKALVHHNKARLEIADEPALHQPLLEEVNTD
ncbi:membrane-spanning 4-domains subfamily A member 8-like [Cynoglossus semilaevis]|uniref:Transmembrane protein 176l.2 n=1 Tax=Cynoglossus semilaevis TaxID=244447 RepID=A0A3P8VWE4_CYNSE|nr:membrane-spanning 4-domains subfamily A member 8-like [Cynoglossus semilaevis]